MDEDSKQQLKAQSNLFKVNDLNDNVYYDGASYFHCIAQLVDLDNRHLVSKVKKKLRHLNVKDFGFDVKKMLAEFKNLITRISDLSGEYSIDDQFLDLWEATFTMKEKEFTRFVKNLEDDESAKEKPNRDTIEEVIRKIGAKQTRMETKGEWNAVSQEDAMIMALTSLVEGKSNSNPESTVGKTNAATTELSSKKKAKLKDSKIPDWKKKPPGEDKPKSMIVDGRTYYWCPKCRNG